MSKRRRPKPRRRGAQLSVHSRLQRSRELATFYRVLVDQLLESVLDQDQYASLPEDLRTAAETVAVALMVVDDAGAFEQ